MGKKLYAKFITRSLEQFNYPILIGQYEDNSLQKRLELAMLKQANVKYNANDVVFAVKDNNGRLYWLEKGNNLRGLNHIIQRHENDFMKRYGVTKENIPGFIRNMIVTGTKTAERKILKNGKAAIEQKYLYKNKSYTLVAVGTNGYIVSVYPTD